MNCKLCGNHEVIASYRVKSFTVYTCTRCGFHYSSVLSSQFDQPTTDAQHQQTIIPDVLEKNAGKFAHYVDLTCQYVQSGRLLDIGSGGGRFLLDMQAHGFEAVGVEPDAGRRVYAQERGLQVVEHTTDHDYWTAYHSTFDAVTLWDVIEHVDWPRRLVQEVYRLLKPGGMFLLATPSRDALFYRAGQLTYRLSGGRFPTFLNAMYSTSPFGHKQIFADHELTDLMRDTGFRHVDCWREAELSFPPQVYVRKLVRHPAAVRALTPVAALAVKALRVRNKVFVAARK